MAAIVSSFCVVLDRYGGRCIVPDRYGGNCVVLDRYGGYCSVEYSFERYCCQHNGFRCVYALKTHERCQSKPVRQVYYSSDRDGNAFDTSQYGCGTL